jgi:hypothetical protein
MYTRSVIVEGNTDWSALPEHLGRCLRDAQASSVQVAGSEIRFTGGLFRIVSNWNVLVPFGSGELRADTNSRQIVYRLSFRQLMVVATCQIGMLGVIILVASRSWLPLVLLPIGWLGLVGGNLIIGLPRFRAFVEHAVSTAPRHE